MSAIEPSKNFESKNREKIRQLKEIEGSWDVTAARQKYIQLLNQRKEVASKYSSKTIENIIDYCDDQKQFIKAYGAKFEVFVENGQKKVILARKNPSDPIKKVLTIEESFDVFLKYHIDTFHGGRDKIWSLLKNEYCIPRSFLDTFISTCQVCKTLKKSKMDFIRDKILSKIRTESVESAFNSVKSDFVRDQKLSKKRKGSVDLAFNNMKSDFVRVQKLRKKRTERIELAFINMKNNEGTGNDGKYNYILLYYDVTTKFVVLRPLMEQCVQEVAMELLKIFLDFGAPTRIETFESIFFKRAIKIIEAIIPEINVYVFLLKHKCYKNDLKCKPAAIKHYLKKWMTETGCENWSIGCHFVQWKYNSTTKTNGEKPYVNMFGIECEALTENQNNEVDKIEITEIDHSKTNSEYENNVTDRLVDKMLANKVIMEAKKDLIVSIENNIERNQAFSKSLDIDDLESLETTVDEIPVINLLSPVDSTTNIEIIKVESENETHQIPEVISVPIGDSKICKPTTEETLSISPSQVTTISNIAKQKIETLPTETQKIPDEKICHECNTKIVKSKNNTCKKCNRPVHMFCSKKTVEKHNSGQTITTVQCFTCTVNEVKGKLLDGKKAKKSKLLEV